MTDHADDVTVDSTPASGESPCADLPPVSADSLEAPQAGPRPRFFRWPDPLRVGDCVMNGMNLELNPGGTAFFSASIGSSDDDDVWVIRGGISLLGGNGAVLFTSEKLVSPTLPEGAETGWSALFNYPSNLFNTVTSARINRAHC
jgi:hypothetical protein